MSDERPLCAALPLLPSPCLYCTEPVTAEDRRDYRECIGLDDAGAMATEPRWIHWECAARMVIGGLNHLRGECGCYRPERRGCDPDPPGMSKREAARAALAEFQRVNRSN